MAQVVTRLLHRQVGMMKILWKSLRELIQDFRIQFLENSFANFIRNSSENLLENPKVTPSDSIPAVLLTVPLEVALAEPTEII